MAYLFDRAEIKAGKAKITAEGYLVADALVGRANNIQAYRAAELGLTDRDPNETVRVFRPEKEVFATDSLETLTRLPITLNHPVKDGQGVMVDANNWREFVRGESGEEILRDGEFIRVPVRITDAGAVTSVQRTHPEFSLGYTCKIDPTPGVYDGQPYDASVTDIRYNHLAACAVARGGAELRITDERTVAQGATAVNTRTINGIAVNLTDAAAVASAIDTLIADRDSAALDLKAAQETIVARDASIVAKDAEIAGLKTQLADASDPARLRDAAAEHAKVLENAKRLGATVTDAMSTTDARRAAVAVKMGDAAKDYGDDHTKIAFDTLVANLGDAAPPASDPLKTVLGDAANVVDAAADFAAARAARFDRLHNGHRTASAS
jgi:hypothetical protein